MADRPSRWFNSWKGRARPDPADQPEWYRAYAAAAMQPPASTPIGDCPLAALDAETTGLDVKRDRIISLGAIQVRGNTIRAGTAFQVYLPTPADLEARSAVDIHGILPNSQRYDYESEVGALQGLLTFLTPATVIVGHHIGFDLAMINQTLARHAAGPLLNAHVDTARLAERIQPKGYWTPPDTFSLDTLARRYRIPLSDRHTALGDAYITAVLWLKLTARLRDRLGREVVVGDVL